MRPPKPPTQAELQRKVDFFNRTVKVGDAVTLRKDDGTPTIITTTTISAAQIQCGERPVVYLGDGLGAWHVDRVSKILGQKSVGGGDAF